MSMWRFAWLCLALAACAPPATASRPAPPPPPRERVLTARSGRLVAIEADAWAPQHVASSDGRFLARPVHVKPGEDIAVAVFERNDDGLALRWLVGRGAHERIAATFAGPRRLIIDAPSEDDPQLVVVDLEDAGPSERRVAIAGPWQVSRDGRWIAGFTFDHHPVLVDAATLATVWTAAVTAAHVSFLPGDRVLAASGPDRLVLFDAANGHTLVDGPAVSFTEEMSYLASRSGRFVARLEIVDHTGPVPADVTVHIHDLDSGHAARLALAGFGHRDGAFAFTADERFLLWSMEPREVMMIDTRRATVQRAGSHGPVNLDPEHHLFSNRVAATDDGTIICGHATTLIRAAQRCDAEVWIDRSGKPADPLRRCFIEGDRAVVLSLPVAAGAGIVEPRGNHLACEDGLRSDGRTVAAIEAHYPHLAILLVDAGTGALKARIPAPDGTGEVTFTYSADGSLLRTRYGGAVRVIDTRDGRELPEPPAGLSWSIPFDRYVERARKEREADAIYDVVSGTMLDLLPEPRPIAFRADGSVPTGARDPAELPLYCLDGARVEPAATCAVAR